MKKLFIGILLGFLMHKGLNCYYDYKWWTYEKQCRTAGTQEQQMQCIYDNLAYIQTMSVILVHPTYTWQKWSLTF